MRRGGSLASIQIFLIVSTCFLYLVAAGLFSKSVWYFQNYKVNRNLCSYPYSFSRYHSGAKSLEETPLRPGQDLVLMTFVRVFGMSM